MLPESERKFLEGLNLSRDSLAIIEKRKKILPLTQFVGQREMRLQELREEAMRLKIAELEEEIEKKKSEISCVR